MGRGWASGNYLKLYQKGAPIKEGSYFLGGFKSPYRIYIESMCGVMVSEEENKLGQVQILNKIIHIANVFWKGMNPCLLCIGILDTLAIIGKQKTEFKPPYRHVTQSSSLSIPESFLAESPKSCYVQPN